MPSRKLRNDLLHRLIRDRRGMIEALPIQQDNTNATRRKWYDSAHSTLSLSGGYLRSIEFFTLLEQRIPIKQKVHT